MHNRLTKHDQTWRFECFFPFGESAPGDVSIGLGISSFLELKLSRELLPANIKNHCPNGIRGLINAFIVGLFPELGFFFFGTLLGENE